MVLKMTCFVLKIKGFVKRMFTIFILRIGGFDQLFRNQERSISLFI
jgi:hypothetical protein